MKDKLILLLLVLSMMTGCAEISESEAIVSSTEEIVTTESIETSETSIISNIQTTELSEMNERQLLIEIYCNELHGSSEDTNTIDYMISRADKLSERVLGEITSEEDAVEKAKTVFIELGLSDWIERAESEFVEIDGEKIKYQRRNKPYSVKFYDEYDACWVMPNPPAGVTEDGKEIDTPAMPPYVIIRKSDGKILGAF